MPALPLDVMPRIFDEVLPTDALARCRAVRKDWRDLLDARADATTRLDLSYSSGTSCTVNDAALAAAARRCAGTLQVLDLTCCLELSAAAIADIVNSNAATLREVCICLTRMVIATDKRQRRTRRWHPWLLSPAPGNPEAEAAAVIRFSSMPNLSVFEANVTCSRYHLLELSRVIRLRVVQLLAEPEGHYGAALRARHAAAVARSAVQHDSGPPVLLSDENFKLDETLAYLCAKDLTVLIIDDVTLTSNTPAETAMLFEALASAKSLRVLGIFGVKDGALDTPAVAQALAALLAARNLVPYHFNGAAPDDRFWRHR